MKPSITIIEVEIDNEDNNKIIISGAENQDDAREAADEWCEEHNSRILEFIQENSSAVTPASPQVYYVMFGSDDYE